MEARELGDALRALGDSYRDGLRSSTRRTIVMSAVQERAPRGAQAWHFLGLLRASAVAAAAVLLAGSFIQLSDRNELATDLQGESDRLDLQIKAEGGSVTLVWNDGDRSRRVVRLTDRLQLARASSLQGDVVSTGQWVDRRPDDAPLIYYVVD